MGADALSAFMNSLVIEGSIQRDTAIVQDNCRILPNSTTQSMRPAAELNDASCNCPDGMMCRWGGPAPQLAPMMPPSDRDSDNRRRRDDDESGFEAPLAPDRFSSQPLFDFDEVLALAGENRGVGGSREGNNNNMVGGSLHSTHSTSSTCSDSPPRSPVRKESLTLQNCVIPLEELRKLDLYDDDDSSTSSSSYSMINDSSSRLDGSMMDDSLNASAASFFEDFPGQSSPLERGPFPPVSLLVGNDDDANKQFPHRDSVKKFKSSALTHSPQRSRWSASEVGTMSPNVQASMTA